MKDNDLLQEILGDAKIGWWQIDTKRNVFILSDLLKDAIDLAGDEISTDRFVQSAGVPFRESLAKELTTYINSFAYERIFSLLGEGKETWFRWKVLKRETTSAGGIISGYAREITPQEEYASEVASIEQVDKLLYQLHTISNTLLSVVHKDTVDENITRILTDILEMFNGSRTYICAFDWQQETITCPYEVTAPKVNAARNQVNKVSIKRIPWFVQHLQDGLPVILSSVDNLPIEASEEREIFISQQIQSMLIVPLCSRDKLWGYAGIDVADEARAWNDENYQWFASLISIVNIYIELQRSEREAQDERDYLQSLYRNMPLGYIRLKMLYNEQGIPVNYKVIDSNYAADTILGVERSCYINRSAEELGLNTQNELSALTQTLNMGRYIEQDSYIQRIDKHLHAVLYSIIKDEVICLLTDISDLKMTEQNLIAAKNKAEESDRLKSAFLANMSHEIRTPLNAIVGFSDLLSESTNPTERLEYQKIVHENSNLLIKLISDILDLSKIEAGTLELENCNFNVNQMCQEVICSLSIKVGKRPIELRFGDHLSECCAISDKERLIQVLINLINNALKFTQKGHITLSYQLIDDQMLMFSVEDTGTGIAENELEQVFGRFVKLNAFAQGTGLGLSICKSIIEQLGGEIGVRSQLGKGSHFWFTIPYVKPHNKEMKCLAKRSLTTPNPTTKRPIVLIAEYTDSHFEQIADILSDEYDVRRAHDGQEVVEMYHNIAPDVILMALIMPRVNGIDATELIRRENRSIPIIAITSFFGGRDHQKAMDAGCDEYMTKPISAELLLQNIAKLLKEQSLCGE